MAPTKGKSVAETSSKPSDILNPVIRKPSRQLIREKTEIESAASRTAAWVLSTSRIALPLPMGPDPPELQLGNSSGGISVTMSSGTRAFDDAFYDRPCEELSRRFLGQVLVRTLPDGRRMTGRIVETEAYPGGQDMASHSYKGKQTPGNVSMYMKPGTAYVYIIYGVYTCFNVSSGGKGSVVLIRALQPLTGLDIMRRNRGVKRKDGGVALQDKDLCSGPSKLCLAMDINKQQFDQRDLVVSDSVWIEKGDDVPDTEVVATARVGIGQSAGLWRAKPLRFYVRGNPFVSVRDKKTEALLPL